MKERLRMRGFLPPEDEALEGFDDEAEAAGDGEDQVGDEPFKEEL